MKVDFTEDGVMTIEAGHAAGDYEVSVTANDGSMDPEKPVVQTFKIKINNQPLQLKSGNTEKIYVSYNAGSMPEFLRKMTGVDKEGETSSIKIADDVVSVIAGKAVSEAPGVYAMAGGFAGGISEVLSGKKNLSKGIKVEVGEKEAKIDVNIIVEYGSRIPDVAFDIQNRVKAAVEGMTGLKVVAVNVHVQGVNTESVTDSEEEKEEEDK